VIDANNKTIFIIKICIVINKKKQTKKDNILDKEINLLSTKTELAHVDNIIVPRIECK
jgi:hypothetical protein